MPLSSRLRLLIALLACLQAILYACVLPLWEGFDEPFHYAYVESLSVHHQLPILNRSPISLEIRKSLGMVPLSRLLSEAIPGTVSFEQWTKLPESQKLARESGLRQLTHSDRTSSGDTFNYEAQQAPLAYFLLAPLDSAFSSVPLRARILLLRLIASVCATIAMFFALDRLGRWLDLAPFFQAAAMLFVFQTQMLWASMAHVTNDLLAIPLTVWFLALLGATARKPDTKNMLWLSAALSAGLLAKAYFLAFVPVFLALALFQLVRKQMSPRTAAWAFLLLATAAPWYLRNLRLYGTLSGTQQAAAGIGITRAMAAFGHLPWIRSSAEFARWSLWTGNWSFTSFSKTTLDIEIFLLLVAFVAYLFLLRRSSHAQFWVLAACVAFVGGLIYQTCVTWLESHGVSTHPEPWYAQGVLAVVAMFCFTGLQEKALWGRYIALALTLLGMWIAALTYLAKLLPYYGASITRSNPKVLWSWWTGHPTQDLQTITFAPVPLVYTLLGIYLLLSITITTAIAASPSFRSSLAALRELPPHRLP